MQLPKKAFVVENNNENKRLVIMMMIMISMTMGVRKEDDVT